MSSSRQIPISDGWEYKQHDCDRDDREWVKARSFPTDIYAELRESGEIPDVNVGFNEHRIQWVAEKEWVWRTVFDLDLEEREGMCMQMVFEGLDTFCEVYLNGEKILSSDNMFITYTVKLPSPTLLKPKANTLLLHFSSAKLLAKTLEAKHGGPRRGGSCNMGDPSRLYVRKAQYGWRWDWGPEVLTCGPWRPIHLNIFTTRLSSVHVHATVSDDEKLLPHMSVHFDLEGKLDHKDKGLYTLLEMHTTGRKDLILKIRSMLTTENRLEDNGTYMIFDEELANSDLVGLWYPTGYGEQKLFDVKISLHTKDDVHLDTYTTRIGFRLVKLIQNPLKEADQYGTGKTFFFEVNRIPIYMGGSNWVPADCMLTNISKDRYRAWLTLLKDGNQNMVRVWGGGIYEPDVFYDTCDELGLLVWQDFQFACGVYPAHDEFVESVRKEAECNVERLRHHPCLALWCGNNEDYQQVLQWGGISELPARIIYEEALPHVITKLTHDDVPYWRGSPYGGKDWDTSDPTLGDVHQWNIWGGTGGMWQDYDKMGGRFVSEFGIPSIPDIRTVNHWFGPDKSANEKYRYSNSPLMVQHNKAGSHEQRFAILMNENFRVTSDFESYIYLTQVLQSEAVSYAYRSWRREWRGPGKEYNGGTLVWQSNDCWPVTSWAIVDYLMRPKPVYYTIKRELAPITVGIKRAVEQNRPHDRPDSFYEFGAFRSTGATIEIWCTNSTLTSHTLTLEIRYLDLQSDWVHQSKKQVILAPNQSTEILKEECKHRPIMPTAQEKEEQVEGVGDVTRSYSVIVHARLVEEVVGVMKVVARYTDWPQPFRYIDFPDPRMVVKVERGDDESREVLRVKVKMPVKCLVLSVREEGEEVKWEDNAVDVFPGDDVSIGVVGRGGRGVWACWMGCEKGRLLELL